MENPLRHLGPGLSSWMRCWDRSIPLSPPVLIASIPEDHPGPSSAVGDQEEEDEEGESSKKTYGYRETEERRARRGWSELSKNEGLSVESLFFYKYLTYVNVHYFVYIANQRVISFFRLASLFFLEFFQQKTTIINIEIFIIISNI